MRIISGKYAKRNLFTLKSQKTRPTSDKVKESLFNSLGQFFDGESVLDLYAGSGALGIEAVSRGCDRAVLNDVSRAASQIIKKNVELTREPERFEVFTMPAKVALKVFADQGRQFDLVFLDPPYAKQQMVKDMAALLAGQLLAPA
ncbi:16S rRNA (guanine(966)-N(2))-methyltransferase RsmD, partial [Lactobacillus nasalidis]